jgi:hypothetical protein
VRSPLSLKGLTPYFGRLLGMTPAALYERQRALVRAGLLKSDGGRGPGSGVRATPYSIALLLIAVLVADSLSEVEESTKLFAYLKSESGICPVTGKKTFGSAMGAILASPSLSRGVHRITVHRSDAVAHIDFIMKASQSSSWFKSARHKRTGVLHVEASLMGFPLDEIAELIAPWFADLDKEPLPSESDQ